MYFYLGREELQNPIIFTAHAPNQLRAFRLACAYFFISCAVYLRLYGFVWITSVNVMEDDVVDLSEEKLFVAPPQKLGKKCRFEFDFSGWGRGQAPTWQ